MVLGLASLLIFSASAHLRAMEPKDVWWVFLEEPKIEVKASKEESAKMFEGHIGNFKRLGKLGKLEIAGPVADPQKAIDGIVVLTVNSVSEVHESFLRDPFVQHKMLVVRAVPMKHDFGRFTPVQVEGKVTMEEDRLVLLESDAPLPREKTDRIREGVKAGLVYHATGTGDDRIREVAMFKGADDKGIEAWIASDPWVKSGILRARVMPQYLVKGTLPDKP